MKFRDPSARERLADELRYTPETLAIVRRWPAGFPEARDLFTPVLRADLLHWLGHQELVELIEAHCYVGGYADPKSHADLNSKVLKLLRADGIKQPVGKKPRPELARMVYELIGLMLAFGVPLGTGTHSPMVLALQAVHKRLGIDGDPRRELCRLLREMAPQPKGGVKSGPGGVSHMENGLP